jgi:predicted aspartyl protease
VTGRVDKQLRALVRVTLRASLGGPRHQVEAWVDTALGLPREAATDAVLADGQTVTVDLFGCHLDWFGNIYQTQAVATDAAHPLLGTQLLAARRLVVDYEAGVVEIT